MNETTSTNIHYYVTPKFMSSARGGHMIRTRLYFICISSNNNNQKQKQKQKIKIRKANRCRHHHPKTQHGGTKTGDVETNLGFPPATNLIKTTLEYS